MTTTDTETRLLERLNPFMRQMLTDADRACQDLPDGYNLQVSAHPDVMLGRPDGHWIGISPDGGRWTLWRGSLAVDGSSYASLADAVAAGVDLPACASRPGSQLGGLLAAARACTGETGPIPPDNWEWVGREHRDGKCSCNS